MYFWITAAAFSLLIHPLSSSFHEWWELKILLSSSGSYKTQKNDFIYSGQYSYSFEWTGCMERDDDDFLLYHEGCRLLDWSAEETAEGPESFQTRLSDDCESQPNFVFIYILMDKEIIDLDFLVEGIKIPLCDPEGNLNITFPVTADNPQMNEPFDYDSMVLDGSNRIFVRHDEICQNDLIERNYSWSWRRRAWIDNSTQPVPLDHRHDVEVDLTIIRHTAKEKKYD